MSMEHEDHGFLHLPHRKKHEEPEHDTSGADQFVESHASGDSSDPDAPVVREDEHYERLSEPEAFPTEQPGDPLLIRRPS